MSLKVYNKNKIQQSVLVSLLIVCVIGIAYLLFGSYLFDKTYTRDDLIDNFNKHEVDFENLVSNFQLATSSSPSLKNYQISLGLGRDKSHVTIMFFPHTVGSETVIVGDIDLDKESPKFHHVLEILDWDIETVNSLEKQLSNVSCDVIRTVNYYGGCKFEIYPKQYGLYSYSYHVFEKPLSDSLLYIHGRTISQSDFGKCVILVRTSIQ